MSSSISCVTAFAGVRLIARGELAAVISAAHAHRGEQPLVFEDETGRTLELDLRGSLADVVAKLAPPRFQPKPARGRPRLGVTAREVTLLPRHWDWLARQPGGASAALRRLVEDARREASGPDAAREALEATYRVMTTLGGDLPGYEDATRALFARDPGQFEQLIAGWPTDVRDYVQALNARIDAPPP